MMKFQVVFKKTGKNIKKKREFLRKSNFDIGVALRKPYTLEILTECLY